MILKPDWKKKTLSEWGKSVRKVFFFNSVVTTGYYHLSPASHLQKSVSLFVRSRPSILCAVNKKRYERSEESAIHNTTFVCIFIWPSDSFQFLFFLLFTLLCFALLYQHFSVKGCQEEAGKIKWTSRCECGRKFLNTHVNDQRKRKKFTVENSLKAIHFLEKKEKFIAYLLFSPHFRERS